MKNSFSLIEVMIAATLLSVVTLSLFQIESNNIHLIEKTNESNKQNQYLNLVIDSHSDLQRDEHIYLDNYFILEDDKIRGEFKEIKIKVKDEVLDKQLIKSDTVNFTVVQLKTNYSLENSLSKNIYRFRLEF